jgi:mRNA interferase HicA
MKRKDVMKRLREIAKEKAVALTTEEGGNHTLVLFDGVKVTTVPRHNEVNELTAKGLLKAAENWTKEG